MTKIKHFRFSIQHWDRSIYSEGHCDLYTKCWWVVGNFEENWKNSILYRSEKVIFISNFIFYTCNCSVVALAFDSLFVYPSNIKFYSFFFSSNFNAPGSVLCCQILPFLQSCNTSGICSIGFFLTLGLIILKLLHLNYSRSSCCFLAHLSFFVY